MDTLHKKKKSIRSKQKDQKILVMTAVAAERDAFLRGVNGDPRFDVRLAGVGPAAAAANTAHILSGDGYDLVISSGIAGGFAHRAGVGSIVIADKIISADLGAETGDGFLSIDELGFGSATIAVDEYRFAEVAAGMKKSQLPVHTGSILTLSTITGTAATAAHLTARYPDAVAEAMEGFGVAQAAYIFQLPAIEIRTISNLVGPRDRSNWKITEALQLLEQASSLLKEVLS
ncbi:futalosine hydrolase [Evansella caseinilytica]|uniref:Futalosine hydrolase n=1 Tax=Evansella caseinilytica TaxID=1503961 RepID=A0A1H3IYE8_9BACI|nr:futalosine hydrolase [Evansella caseinilytica]SDY32319.1 futalosine hydrolase [Evansella caseinilytica]